MITHEDGISARCAVWSVAMEFDECGGYDCMTAAWTIRDPQGNIRIEIDLRLFGQRNCDSEYRSQEAEDLARSIVDALNMRDKG